MVRPPAKPGEIDRNADRSQHQRDELEKGFSGTGSSGQTDGGTTARVFGTFLSWLQDRRAPVFVVASANDVSNLPPELLRKGRFDEIFYFDLPTAEERKAILTVHLWARRKEGAGVGELNDYDLDVLATNAEGFVGAELEAAVVDGLYGAFDRGAGRVETEDILRALKTTVPLRDTMRERIDGLREWAKGRARFSSIEAARAAGIKDETLLDLSGQGIEVMTVKQGRIVRLSKGSKN